MTTETIVRSQDAAVRPSEAPAVSPLERIAAEVRRDSQQNADEYLKETLVPHGGE